MHVRFGQDIAGVGEVSEGGGGKGQCRSVMKGAGPNEPECIFAYNAFCMAMIIPKATES